MGLAKFRTERVQLRLALTRRWLVNPGLLLHAGFYVLLPIVTFSATMFVLYLAYFDADTIHSVIDRLSGVPEEATRDT